MNTAPLRIGYCLSVPGALASNGKTAQLAHQIWQEKVLSLLRCGADPSKATRDIQELERCHQEIAALRPEVVICSWSRNPKSAEPEELQICT